MTAHVKLDPSLQQGLLTTYCQGINNLYSDGHFNDLKVIISGSVFECHRLVLASVSEFFRSSLTASWRESSSCTVEINHEDVTSEAFQILLDILYKGHNVISTETVEDVLRMSIYLFIPFLEEFCVKFLSKNMPADKCLRFWFLALTYNLPSVCDSAKETACKHLCKVHRQAEFPSLPKSELLILLSEAVLDTSVCVKARKRACTCTCVKSSMDDLLNTVLVWVESDKVRYPRLGELLPFVDAYRLSPVMKQLIVTRYAQHELGGILLNYLGLTPSHLRLSNATGSKDADKADTSRDTSWLTSKVTMTKCGVIVGGYKCSVQPSGSVVAFTLSEGRADIFNEDNDDDSTTMYSLSPLPESFDGAVATCVWNNELYVSGIGTKNFMCFAVYRTAQNKWEMLPPPPVTRLEHAIAAVNFNIYFFGGCTESLPYHPVSDILVYDTQTGTWSKCGDLVVAVTDPKVAAVGHRVYIFSGWYLPSWKCGKDPSCWKASDFEIYPDVQCFDTLTGNTYLAGSTHGVLKMPPEQVISNGGTVFVMESDEGHVARLVENFSLADERERTLAFKRGTQRLVPLDVPAKNASLPSLVPETDQNAASLGEFGMVQSHATAAETKGSACLLPTVTFKSVGNMRLEESVFCSYLYNNEFVRCTLCDDHSDIRQEGHGFINLIGIDVKSGVVKQRNHTLPCFKTKPSIRLLNIPSHYLATEAPQPEEACYRICFCLADLACYEAFTQERTVGNMVWSVTVLKCLTEDTDERAVGVHFGLVSGLRRNQRVRTCFRCFWVYPNMTSFRDWHMYERVFVENDVGIRGWEFLWERLRELEQLCGGKLTIEYRIKPEILP